jgi:hypothetical protein
MTPEFEDLQDEGKYKEERKPPAKSPPGENPLERAHSVLPKKAHPSSSVI